MRSLIKLLILFGLAIIAVLFLKDNNDVVMIITGDERRTMSLMTAIVIGIIIFFFFYIILRVIANIVNIPSVFSQWSEHRYMNKDVALLEKGWVELLEGRSAQAEKDLLRLIKHTNDDKRQILASIAAARVAQDLGKLDRRDKLLASARQLSVNVKSSRLEAAVATVQAELLLEQGQSHQALEHLDFVRSIDQNIHVQELMLRGYRQTGQTLKMLEVARYLHRKKALSIEELQSLISYYGAIYMRSVSQEEALAFYKSLDSKEKALPAIAIAMASRYEPIDEYRKAGESLENALNNKIDKDVLAHYVKCPESEVSKRLSFAQQLLNKDPQNIELLIALGQLCLIQKLWGQADRYLMQSLDIIETPKAYALLGILNDRQGRPQEAVRYWRLASSFTISMDKSEKEEVLLAADMSNDPAPPDIKNLDKPDDHFFDNKIEYSHSVGNHSSTDEELFDSAPIPGVEQPKS